MSLESSLVTSTGSLLTVYNDSNKGATIWDLDLES